jgi:hypothetical protein
MKKETAVEWLVEQIKSDQNQKALSASEWMEVIEQAKAMEREQIVEAWNSGDYAYFYSKETGREFEDGSEYYNETYKGGEQ